MLVAVDCDNLSCMHCSDGICFCKRIIHDKNGMCMSKNIEFEGPLFCVDDNNKKYEKQTQED